MFPANAAGFALVILRCCVALQMISEIPILNLEIPSWFTWLLCAVVVVALCLGAGTPVVSALCFLLQFSDMQPRNETQTCAFLASLGLPLVLFLLGPGAYSIDAKLYGRRIISTRRR